MTQFKKTIAYVLRHVFIRPVYLYTYIKNYINPEYLIDVNYYDTSELVGLLKSGKSLIRLGDGELYIMNGGGIHYQTFARKLQKYLFCIVKNYTNDSNYVVGLNKIPISKSNKQLKKDALLTCWLPMKVYWNLYFNRDARYFDATAFYYNETIPKYFEEYFKTKQLILLTRRDTITSLQNNSKFPFTAIDYIETPERDSFAHQASLLKKIEILVNSYSKEKTLVLLACGPASKSMAMALAEKEILSIDVGRGIEVAYTSDRIDHIIYPGM